jgi:GNAT superfamily N-acetyltransferase
MLATKDDYFISTDKDTLDIPYIHRFLTTSYWAEGIPEAIVQSCIQGSLCFGLYHGKQQIGFARVISDQATFAYLADVFIDETYRGKELSKWLMEIILHYPGLQGLRRFLLATRDAHGLYAQFGFTPLPNPDRFMQLHFPDVYKKDK